MKKVLVYLLILSMLFSFAACSATDGRYNYYAAEKPSFDSANEDDGSIAESDYGKLVENPFVSTSKEPISTFSADVDTASYAYFRKLVNGGYSLSELIATAGNDIRTEEMINYFDYNYPEPEEGKLFSVSANLAPCPWNSGSKLLVLGLQADKVEAATKNNLVFLIDVSGSMNSSDKLGLLKSAFSHLTDKLGDDDTVSIVTYSGNEKIVLEGCSGAKKDKIMNAVNNLEADGSTNGEAGIRMAYSVAEKYFIKEGNNRIILASDGDLNVGISSPSELEQLVTDKRKSGVFLSVLGFGTGNYKDANMETIADCGNGVYYYIDGESEAEKVFGQDIFSTLYTVAKDVKLQLTFNAEAISEYRLIGYENRLLNKEDFENDTKDAGEMGAGHSVTVCYELVMKENADEEQLMKLAVRYKAPDGDKSNLEEYSLGREIVTDNPNDYIKFISALIETAMVIHNSEYKGDVTLESIVAKLGALDLSSDSYKEQFRTLMVKLAESSKK